jgi:hypothetical protein
VMGFRLTLLMLVRPYSGGVVGTIDLCCNCCGSRAHNGGGGGAAFVVKEGQVFVEREGQAFVEGEEQVFEEAMSPTDLIYVGEAL